MLEAGKFYKFKVTRKTDLGFMLNDGEEEVLMHYRQAEREYEVDEQISAFIYYDKEGRFCATTKNVYASAVKPGLCEVVEVNEKGLFLDINTSKDVLLSTDFLPYNKELWPDVNEKLYVILKDKKKSLIAKPINKEQCLKYKTADVIENMTYEAVINNINKGGYGLITKDLVYIFVPFIMTRGKHHLGEAVKVKITKIKESDVYGSMIEVKEKQMVDDKKIILDYLLEHNGYMPFTAKSSSEAIELAFKISRKAFKRAYGELYKERQIAFDEKGTTLIEKK